MIGESHVGCWKNAVEKILSEKYTVPLAASEKPEGKPVAMWLGAAAIAIGIIYWLIPEKTLSRVVVSLLAIFVLLVHPVWNFWWIEKKLWSRSLALLVLAVGLSTLGYFTWQSRARVIEQLNALAGKN
jgi:Na+/melibiose symporter-like transporter